MRKYYLIGLYRYLTPFPVDVVVRSLSAIARWLPDFFPGQLPVARKRAVSITSPADFDPALVPTAFVIESGPRTLVPIYGRHGVKLDISDDRAPMMMIPASVLVEFTEALPPLTSLEGLLGDLVETLQPDDALLRDNATPIEPEVKERRFEIDRSKVPPYFSWLTWLNPGVLEAAGPEALGRLSALCQVRRLGGGALVRVQDEPTRGEDPEWSRRRQAAEDAFGLDALQRRFPREESPEVD